MVRKHMEGGRTIRDLSAQGADTSFTGRDRLDHTERHEQTFKAVSALQEHQGGEAAHLEAITRAAGPAPEETRVLPHDLTQAHGLVTALSGGDEPDRGPRFEVKPRM